MTDIQAENDDNRSDNDEKFGAFVQQSARGYNAPGDAVPREEMWVAIGAARAAARAAARRSAARRKQLWIVAGMAATLVIGVAIGRYDWPTAANSTSNGASEVEQADSGNNSYQVAATNHLVRAEAMLTSFATASNGALADSALARWAGDLLSNTRLLLDSPAGSDPARRQLLQDLERVLVQIVHRSPAESDAEVRAHVERSIDRTHMLMRLRATQSAALSSGS